MIDHTNSSSEQIVLGYHVRVIDKYIEYNNHTNQYSMFLFNWTNFGTEIKHKSYSMYLSATLHPLEGAVVRCLWTCFHANADVNIDPHIWNMMVELHSTLKLLSMDIFVFFCYNNYVELHFYFLKYYHVLLKKIPCYPSLVVYRYHISSLNQTGCYTC